MLGKNCFSKPFIEGKIGGRIEVTRRRRRRSSKLLDGLEESSGCWKLKQEALNRAVWRQRLWTYRKRLHDDDDDDDDDNDGHTPIFKDND
jgi:hypothetical protein